MTTPTRDEVIQMASDAGYQSAESWPDGLKGCAERLVAAAYARGAAAEREARQTAQTQVAELQERLNRADAEKCAAVLAERAAYSIDEDPSGIRAKVCDAVTGALAFGAQDANPPPDGHWLDSFWRMARGERESAEQALLAEREACARVAESEPRSWIADAPDPQTRIATAIRARTQP